MKKVTFIIIVTFLLSSCVMKVKKTNDFDSLLDIGFSRSIADSIEKEKSIPAMFKSKSNTNYGIDISHFQGNDLKQIDAKKYDLSFVICKATQGAYFVDPDFRKNWHEIKEKGLIRGTYHFYDCNVDPIVQANHFTSIVSEIGPNDIAPVLDIEQGSMSKDVSGEQMVKDILVFLKAVEKKLNRKPILYTNYDFAQGYLKDSQLANYNLWLAEYSGGTKPIIPDTWKEKGCKIWQKSSSYQIGSEKIDFDEFYGLLSEIVK